MNLSDRFEQRIGTAGNGVLDIIVRKDMGESHCHLIVHGSETRKLKCGSVEEAKDRAPKFVAAVIEGLRFEAAK